VPFTPFHMGPALAFKALAGRRFSVLVFGLAQVAMDIEPLIGMLSGWEVLHGWTHTWLGATLIGLLVAAAAPPLARLILASWNRFLEGQGLPWLASPPVISRMAAASGAMLGTWSHVLLDGVMHADMHPLAPWSKDNLLLGALPTGELHLFCVGAGIVGMMAWMLAGMFRRDRATAAGAGRPPSGDLPWPGPVVSSRPAIFAQRQTWQFAAGAGLLLAGWMAQGAGHFAGWEGVALFGFLFGWFALLGAGLFSLGTAWGGMQRLPAGRAPFLAGLLVTASWVLLGAWQDALPMEPGIAGATAHDTQGGLRTLWMLLAPALAGLLCAWLARWRRAREAASDPGAR
jgi:membrane-bound metal-dependent hydrolase YbcI (DUF457 family)